MTNVLKLPGPLLGSTCKWPLFISDKLPNSFTVSSVIQYHHGTDQVSGHVLRIASPRHQNKLLLLYSFCLGCFSCLYLQALALP